MCVCVRVCLFVLGRGGGCWRDVVSHTGDFVARDLQTVVNRALHCHMAAVATGLGS